MIFLLESAGLVMTETSIRISFHGIAMGWAANRSVDAFNGEFVMIFSC